MVRHVEMAVQSQSNFHVLREEAWTAASHEYPICGPHLMCLTTCTMVRNAPLTQEVDGLQEAHEAADCKAYDERLSSGGPGSE